MKAPTDTEMLDWLLGRLHIERSALSFPGLVSDIWSTVGFSAPHWDCKEKGLHDMRTIVAQAMRGE